LLKRFAPTTGSIITASVLTRAVAVPPSSLSPSNKPRETTAVRSARAVGARTARGARAATPTRAIDDDDGRAAAVRGAAREARGVARARAAGVDVVRANIASRPRATRSARAKRATGDKMR
jgi:hypothetical protein